MSRPHIKTPSEVLDYGFDWSRELETDTISSSVWNVDSGLNVVSQGHDATTTSVFIGGGTAGATYAVTNTITTAGGRTESRTLHVVVVGIKTL